VMKKLGNASFVDNAPRNVVDKEIQKKNDAESRIKVLQQQMEALRG